MNITLDDKTILRMVSCMAYVYPQMIMELKQMKCQKNLGYLILK